MGQYVYQLFQLQIFPTIPILWPHFVPLGYINRFTIFYCILESMFFQNIKIILHIIV